MARVCKKCVAARPLSMPTFVMSLVREARHWMLDGRGASPVNRKRHSSSKSIHLTRLRCHLSCP
eukprot:14052139-Alexandrium_andersonii.AAC.1